MNRMMLLGSLLSFSLAIQAQTERRIYTQAEKEEMSAEKQEQRRLRKVQEELQDSLDFVRAMKALEGLDFVMEADRVRFKRGTTLHVSSVTNFISLQDDQAVVQVAPAYAGGGPNGVGGITLEGRASGIVLRTDRKGNVYFNMSVTGTGISATVSISMVKGSNRATVRVAPNLHSRSVTLEGVLLPSAESNVFQGRSL